MRNGLKRNVSSVVVVVSLPQVFDRNMVLHASVYVGGPLNAVTYLNDQVRPLGVVATR